MSRVAFDRTIPYDPEDVMDVILDFLRYPVFVPGVINTKIATAKGKDQPQEVEAFLKSAKFSGTVRVAVEADRSSGRIAIKPRYGPFKILSATINMRRLGESSTAVRFDAELASSIQAVNALISKHLRPAALAYAEVFIAELARRAELSRATT